VYKREPDSTVCSRTPEPLCFKALLGFQEGAFKLKTKARQVNVLPSVWLGRKKYGGKKEKLAAFVFLVPAVLEVLSLPTN